MCTLVFHASWRRVRYYSSWEPLRDFVSQHVTFCDILEWIHIPLLVFLSPESIFWTTRLFWFVSDHKAPSPLAGAWPYFHSVISNMCSYITGSTGQLLLSSWYAIMGERWMWGLRNAVTDGFSFPLVVPTVTQILEVAHSFKLMFLGGEF